MDWLDQAACKNMPLDLFYPGVGDTKAVAAAKAICERCPVTEECLANALSWPASEDYGVRGGLAPKQRARIRRKIAALVAERFPTATQVARENTRRRPDTGGSVNAVRTATRRVA